MVDRFAASQPTHAINNGGRLHEHRDQPFYSQQAHGASDRPRFGLAPCPTCHSTRWRKTTSGLVICEHGHQSLEYREEQGEADLSVMGATRRLAGPSKRRKTVRSTGQAMQMKQTLIKGVLGENAEGDVERFLVLAALQLFVKAHAEKLADRFGLPQEPFLATVRAIWLHYIHAIGVSYTDSELGKLCAPRPRPPIPFPDRISPSISLVVNHLALRHHRVPVMLSDLHRMAAENVIPYFAFPFPAPIVQRLAPAQRRIFRPRIVYSLSHLHHAEHCLMVHLMDAGFDLEYTRWAELLLVRFLGFLGLPLTWHAPIMRIFAGLVFREALGLARTVRYDYYSLGYVPLEHTLAACLIFYASIHFGDFQHVESERMHALVRHWTRPLPDFDISRYRRPSKQNDRLEEERFEWKHLDRYLTVCTQTLSLSVDKDVEELLKAVDQAVALSPAHDTPTASVRVDDSDEGHPWLDTLDALPTRIQLRHYRQFTTDRVPFAYSELLKATARIASAEKERLQELVRGYFEPGNVDAGIAKILHRKTPYSE